MARFTTVPTAGRWVEVGGTEGIASHVVIIEPKVGLEVIAIGIDNGGAATAALGVGN